MNLSAAVKAALVPTAIHELPVTFGALWQAANSTTNLLAHNWATFTLPYIEQQATFNSYNLQSPYCGSVPGAGINHSNHTSISTLIGTLLCPSSATGDRIDTGTATNALTGAKIDNWKAAASDYAVNEAVDVGVTPAFADPAQDQSPPSPGSIKGVMFGNKLRRIAEVTDGLSNTFVISEDAGRPGRYVSGSPRPGRVSGAGWADNESEYFAHGVSGARNCHTNCDNDNEDYSFHPGGANKFYGDGSVRFMKATVSMRVFARLMSIGSGEIISADSY